MFVVGGRLAGLEAFGEGHERAARQAGWAARSPVAAIGQRRPACATPHALVCTILNAHRRRADGERDAPGARGISGMRARKVSVASSAPGPANSSLVRSRSTSGAW